MRCAMIADTESKICGCVLSFVPELITEHINFMCEMALRIIMDSKPFTRPLQDQTCHCLATIEELAKEKN